MKSSREYKRIYNSYSRKLRNPNYSIPKNERKLLETTLRTMINTANKRLERIEKEGLQELSGTYKEVRDRAEDGLRFYVFKNGNNTASPRFRGKISGKNGLSDEDLIEMIHTTDKFLNYHESSTLVKKIKEADKNAYKAFSENFQERYGYDTNISIDEFRLIRTNNNYRKLMDMYGSDIIIDLFKSTELSDLSPEELEEIVVRSKAVESPSEIRLRNYIKQARKNRLDSEDGLFDTEREGISL